MTRSDSDIAAVVLAAGAGVRLQPLTLLRPKALCPVNNVALVDHAIARAHSVTPSVAVNVHNGRAQMVEHLGDRVLVSVEPHLLGTAGALGKLREWIDGRAVLVINADGWHPQDPAVLLQDWNGRDARLLAVEDPARADFGTLRYCGVALLPWRAVAQLEPVFSGLYDRCFEPLHEAGGLSFIKSTVPFIDCGSPADYHAANMAASRGANVVGEGARIEGEITRCVIWPGARVHEGEHLVGAIRAVQPITVQAENG